MQLIKKFVDRARRLARRKGFQRSSEDDFSIGVPFGYEPTISSRPFRIAGVCHIFFTDLASEMLEELTHIPFMCDLYISTDSDAKRHYLQQVFSGWKQGSVEIRLVENRGRDIAPKLVTFRDVYANYDLLIFTHSKKSHIDDEGLGWRKFIVNNLLGSPRIVASIVDAFVRMPSLGMIVSQHYEPIRAGGWLDWQDNYRLARQLALRMGINLHLFGVVDFPSGSMFWTRPAALMPLLNLNLATKDFPTENGQIDGTIAHAIERLFLYSCECAGLIWLKVAEPSMFKNCETIELIRSPADLDSFVKNHLVRLIRS